jgi:hypothetical protein
MTNHRFTPAPPHLPVGTVWFPQCREGVKECLVSKLRRDRPCEFMLAAVKLHFVSEQTTKKVSSKDEA